MYCMAGVRADLVVGQDAAVAELDVAGVPPPLVAEDGHQGQLARGLEGRLDGRVAALEVGVAVEDEERRAQQRQRPPDRAGGPAQLRAVERVGDLQAERRAVADGLDDLLAQVAQAEDDPADPLVVELAELVVDERPARHLQQALGRLLASAGPAGSPGRRPGSRRAAGSLEMTFVPSKSNRNMILAAVSGRLTNFVG